MAAPITGLVTVLQGTISGLVRSEMGYHIIKVVDHAMASTVPFDQAGAALADWDANPASITKILVSMN